MCSKHVVDGMKFGDRNMTTFSKCKLALAKRLREVLDLTKSS